MSETDVSNIRFALLGLDLCTTSNYFDLESKLKIALLFAKNTSIKATQRQMFPSVTKALMHAGTWDILHESSTGSPEDDNLLFEKFLTQFLRLSRF